MQYKLIALLPVVAFLGGTAFAEGCPPKGEKFIKDSYVVRWVITSTGEPMDPLLGCPFTNENGERHYERLNMIAYLPKASKPPKPAPPVAINGALSMGVYECEVPISIGGMVQGTPSTGHFFGLIDGKNYRDFNGKNGTYSLNGDILTMVSGPLKGVKYKRLGAKFFKPLDKNGAIGSISCKHNASKSLKGIW